MVVYLIVFSFVLLTVGVALVWNLVLAYPRATDATVVLNRREQATVRACADSLFPAGKNGVLSGSAAGLVDYLDQSLARMTRDKRLLIRLLLFFVEHSPWVWGPLRPRFSRLKPEARHRVLDEMARSSIYFRRVGFLSLRTLLCMGYLAHPKVLDRLGVSDNRSPFASTRLAIISLDRVASLE